MNTTLKERVNAKRIKFAFISAVFLCLCISKPSAQENQPPFDYTRTIWIIHNIDGKGIVYGMGNYASPRSSFIIIHKVLMKYVNNLESFPDNTSANDLTPEYRLVLMNDLTEQQLLLGSNWISDGQRIALMNEPDFNTAKEILTHRAKIDTAFSKHPINPLLKNIRKQIQDYPEEFDYRLQLYKEANAKELLATRKISSASSSSEAPATKSDPMISSYSSNALSSHASENRTASNSELVNQPSSTEITKTSTNEDDNFNVIPGMAVILLTLLGGFWLVNRSKK